MEANQTNQSLNELFTALAKAQAEMPMATLSSNNPFFKSKYADLPELVRASRPVLTKYGLAIVQTDWRAGDGTMMLKTILGHCSGQFLESNMAIMPTKNDVQSVMSYRSYCRRYAYASICGVVADEFDDDGNAASTSNNNLPSYGQIAGATLKTAPPKQDFITKEQYDSLLILITNGDIANAVKERFDMTQLTGLKNIYQDEYGNVMGEIQRIRSEMLANKK